MTTISTNTGRIPAGEFAHTGERVVQQRTGLAFPGPIRDHVPRIAADFLLTQQISVVAGRDQRGRVWATMLSGPPGFMRAPDHRTVEVHAKPGSDDPLALLLREGGEVGMLIYDRNHRMRVNGPLTPTDDGFQVHTEHVYANCHKHISERHPRPVGPVGAEPVVSTSDALTAAEVAQIRAADTFMIGSAHPDGPADASHRGGNPGFVIVDGPTRIRWPDYVGNAMFNTLGNLMLDPHIGLLFPDWSRDGMLQISGRASVNWDPAAAAELPGAQRVVEMDVDAVRYTGHATGLKWSDPILSPFNY